MASEKINANIQVVNAPDIAGLTFRNYQGKSDFVIMSAIVEASNKADQIKEGISVEDFENRNKNNSKVDLFKDVLIAEVSGEAVAYAHVFWEDEHNGPRVYFNSGFVLATWRRKGLGGAMHAHNEKRIREIAASHPPEIEKVLECWAADTELGSNALFQKSGYEPIRYFFLMLRDLNEPIPDATLPENLEIRPADESQYRQIFAASNEAFRDHWGHVEATEESYQRRISRPNLNPALWKVAWDGDEVAGMVLNEINTEENKQFGLNWGWTDPISVRRPWRRRGLARALILESLKELKSLGFSHAALGVDTQNPQGALKLYEDSGYVIEERWIDYRKKWRKHDNQT